MTGSRADGDDAHHGRREMKSIGQSVLAVSAFAACCALLLPSFHARAGLLDPMPVIEYHNTNLDHYFLALSGEAALIDAGAAGPGWEQTGRYFLVEPFAYVLYGKYLCRFYGSVSPGPNSHFFTLNSEECDFLKYLESITPPDQPRWNYEGLAFPAGVADEHGACPGATNPYDPYKTPVYRFYNNGWARGIDSNHRYVTSPYDIDQMIRAGWILEGVAFCAY